MFCGATRSASLPPAQGETNVEKVSTHRTDHDRDHLDPNQPLRDVVQGLCSTDQTQKTRAISCRLNGFPSENDLSYRPGMSLPPKICQGRYFSGDRSSVRCVKASLAEGEKPPNVARAAGYHHPLSIDRQIEQKRAASIPPA